MPEPDDITLLKRYAGGDESAFAVLFERHVHLVYSTALRQARNPSHAEEVTQTVFILLARKGKSLSPKTVVSGWLYQAARLTTASLIKREIRRQRREQEVFMQTLTEPETPLWEQISPLLDEAMGQLGEQDRNAIVLRYFETRTPQEVAVALKLDEVTARKRVSRALEKLRRLFAKRGVVLTADVIAGTISGNSVQAAPAALANPATAIAIAKGAMAGGSTLTLVKGALKIMAWTKTRTIVTTAIVATVSTGLFEAQQISASHKQVQNLQQQQDSRDEQLAQLQRERDEAAGKLGRLLAKNAQLKSGSTEDELLKLRGEVTAARAASEAAAKTAVRRSGASPTPTEPDYLRNQTRANLDQFFKLANVPPEKAERYVDLEVEMKRRQNERVAGLLRGTLSVADAVRQRDQDNQAQQDQRREILGPDGWPVLQSVADGMRNDTAKRLTGTVQANLASNPLTQEQSDRLQNAIKAEVSADSMDDTDLFRPVDEWTQMVTDREQHVLQAASEFLTPAQLGTLQFLEGENLKLLLQQREQRLKVLATKQ